MKSIIQIVVVCMAPAIVLIAVARGIHIAKHGIHTSSYDHQQGREIFAVRCAGCHNITGTQIAKGPNLSQIGSTAGHRKPGMSAAAYILESILKPREFKTPGSSGEMPANLVSSYDDEAIRNLVAFLSSRGGTSPDSEIRSLLIERPVVADDVAVFEREQVLRGEQLYRGKAGCAICHPFYGGSEFDATAPYIFYRGHRDEKELRRAIIYPHASIAPRYKQTTITLSNGKTLTGRLIHQTESNAAILVNVEGEVQLRLINTDDIEQNDDDTPMIQENATSVMPSGLDNVLTASELDDLLAFLIAAN